MIYDISNITDLLIDFDNYESLIAFYRQVPSDFYKTWNIYTELHHILPRCMGGKNLLDNLVNLPWMIHVFAHFLLAKKLENIDNSLSIKNYYAVKMILNQDKVIKKEINFESIKAKTILKAIELETKNRLNCKRIYVNKDSKTIQIFEDNLSNYIQFGYKVGRIFRNNRGKIWINNGSTSRTVHKDELLDYLAQGWKRGMYKTEKMQKYDRGKSLPKTKGCKWVYKDAKRLLVAPNKLEDFIQQGWTLGTNLKPMLGKTYKLSEEQKKQISERLKGRVWWNNGEVSIKSKTCPEGFLRGKLHENTKS